MPLCVRGAQWTWRSPGCTSSSNAHDSIALRNVRWLWRAPFGNPVVPPVYWIQHSHSASTSGAPLKRTPADNQTVRNVFVVGPDKNIKLILVYPMTTGRNFDEVLRVIDSLQLTAKHRVATPVNWKQGEDVIIAGSVSDDEAKKIYPQGWKAPRPYLRIVPQPR